MVGENTWELGLKKTSVFSCRVKKLTQNSVGRNHPIKKEVGKYKLGGKC